MKLKVSKVRRLAGKVLVPGDKSISHRAVILGAVAEGRTRITGFLNTGDCLSTLRCLSALGVRVEGVGGDKLIVQGRGLFGLVEPADILDAGNSGTTMRLLAGLLAGQRFFSVISGDESLNGRPMGRVTKPLRKMGARIWGRRDAEYAPLAVSGAPLIGQTHLSPIASAQVKSALLLAGLLAEGKTTVKEPHLTRDHTERLFKLMGAKISARDGSTTVVGHSVLKGATIDIPGDFSSAAFLITAASVILGSDLVVRQVGVSSSRIGLVEALRRMGASIEIENTQVASNEPRADIRVKAAPLTATVIEGEVVPRMIDEIPALAVAATQAEGKTVFKGVAELRVKETDRIDALATELKKLGAQIEQQKGGFTVSGPTRLKGAPVESLGDHRIAMALAVAGLIASGTTTVNGAECIDISFPNFARVLERVSE